MTRTATAKVIELGSPPTNGGKAVITGSTPWAAHVAIEGVSDLLFHRWNVEAVEAKASAAKGSKEKKSDDLESYVYRTAGGELAIPGEYVRQAVILAAKFRQDPRSPRKSAMDLVKAGLVCTTDLAPLGKDSWDYEDKRRVVVQRNGITRTRPAIRAGWSASFDFSVNLPEYISPDMLHDLISMAGKLCGIGDFRPTYGRFHIASWETGAIE